MRRVLHFFPWGLRSPHPETDLELIQGELDQGSAVRVLVCNASFPSCDLSLERTLTICGACVARRREGISRLDRRRGSLQVSPVMNLTAADRAELAALPRRFASMSELAEFSFHGFDAGLGVSSSLVSQLRNPAPSTHEHARTIHGLLLSACAVFLSTRNWIEQDRPDHAYVCNGRYATQRAFFRACRQRSVPCDTHERGATLDKYALFPNTLPHDREHFERRARAAWVETPREEAAAIGARFFEDRAQGKTYSFHSFTTAQRAGLLPEPWPEERVKVAIFLSSEDEFIAIGPDWKNPLYAGQWEGLFAILRDLARDERLHVYVRCHPNSASVIDVNFDRLRALAASSPRLTVIEPASPVSTYQLLRGADRVVSFGSTVGIEATYWRRPSILAGMSLYRGLDATYIPATHEELVGLVRAHALPPKPLEGALIFAHYLSTFGIPYRDYEATGVGTGRFRGAELTADAAVHRLVVRVSRVPGVPRLRDHARSVARAFAGARLVGPSASLAAWLRRERP